MGALLPIVVVGLGVWAVSKLANSSEKTSEKETWGVVPNSSDAAATFTLFSSVPPLSVTSDLREGQIVSFVLLANPTSLPKDRPYAHPEEPIALLHVSGEIEAVYDAPRTYKARLQTILNFNSDAALVREFFPTMGTEVMLHPDEVTGVLTVPA